MATWSNVTNLSLTERTARSQAVDNHPMWKRPYFEYRKNARVNKNWHTNNVGFRDGDVALPKPPEVFRIACLGGSATEEGLTNEVTYPHRVEQKLQAHFQDPHIEVINCGVVGLDILGERQRALEFALLEPDLVIQYNAGNDLCHALVPDWERQIGGWRKLLRRSRFAVRYWNRLVWPDSTTISEQIDRTMLANLATLHALLTRRGIAVAVCSFAHPDLGRLSREERDYFDWHARTAWGSQFLSLDTYCWLVDLYNEKVKAFCAEKGALYIPVAEELEGTTAHFGDIAHMRPTGIERKAEIVFEHLKTQIPGLRKHAAISPSP
jgi:hypothetical protein